MLNQARYAQPLPKRVSTDHPFVERLIGTFGASIPAHTATVTFDAAKTTPQALAAAVSRAGFPAKVLGNGS